MEVKAMRRLVTIVVVVLALTIVLGACQRSTDSDGTGAETPPASPPSDTIAGMVAAPGLYDQPDGSVQALGTLAYRDVEGGFWAVVDTAVPDDADTASVVAVIVPDNDIAGKMDSFKGKYVSIIGKREDGPNIYQAGPVIEGKTIEEVSDTVVE
jgi:hypothetical protein